VDLATQALMKLHQKCRGTALAVRLIVSAVGPMYAYIVHNTVKQFKYTLLHHQLGSGRTITEIMCTSDY